MNITRRGSSKILSWHIVSLFTFPCLFVCRQSNNFGRVGTFRDHIALFLAWNSAFSFPPCGIKRSQSDQSCSTWRRCAAYRNHITLWWLKSVACLVELRVKKRKKKKTEMEALCRRRILCSPLQLLNTYSTFHVSEVCRLDPLRPPPFTSLPLHVPALWQACLLCMSSPAPRTPWETELSWDK